MKKCPLCKTECPENANFCLHCGASLKSNLKIPTNDEIDSSKSNETMIQALKRLMPTSYVDKLLASKGNLEGERRVVTILFSDIKGSTTLEENLDPEEVLELMNGAFNVLIEPITHYEGTIARLMGDAILAFFGAPIAHEDDPQRACRAALDILKGAREFSKKLELDKGFEGFGVRVGINTGLVVVAEVGTDLRVEYTAMGDAVNIAARMESSAEPGTILITEATKKLIQNDFELKSLGSIKVKGKSEPINTYRILDIKKDENKQKSPNIFHSPLIGREKELKRLLEALTMLQQGMGGIISIIGESGVGKSRLVAEISNKEPAGLKWIEGKALTYTVNNSYWLVRSILKNLLGFHQESFDKALFETLHKKVKMYFEDKFEEIFPFLEHFLKLPSEIKDTQGIKDCDARTFRDQIHYALKEFILKESKLQPIVLAIEDLQWCDSPSLELINELLPLVAESPIILLLQYRLEENEKRIWDFHNKNVNEYNGKYDVISLHPLRENESFLLLENLLGDRKLPLEIKNQIIKKIDGNPSFLEEMIHSILEDGSCKSENISIEKYGIRDELHTSSLLQNVIMARVDCLQASEKILLQTASVIGRVFQKKLLANVTNDNFKESEFEKSLKELQIREFILRHLPSNIISKTSNFQKEYIFKQEIAQNVLYNSLLLSYRQSLHKRIGEEIENLYPDKLKEIANSLALHFERGKVFTKAIHYNKISADRAKDLFANEDAIFFYSKTLKLAEEVELTELELAQIHESLGDVYSLTANYSKAIEHFKLSLNYQKDPNNFANIYFKCGQIFESWGKYAEALSNFNKSLDLLDKDNEKVLKAHIFAAMGMVYYRQENLIEAKKLNEQALLILKEKLNEKDLADIYNNLGIINCKMGNLDKSLDFHKKCLNIREQIGFLGGLGASNNNLGYLYQLKNDFEKAFEYYNKSLEYCEKIGNLHGLARTYDNLSHIYITQGNQELAMDYNLKAISILGRIAKDGALINSDVWLQSSVW